MTSAKLMKDNSPEDATIKYLFPNTEEHIRTYIISAANWVALIVIGVHLANSKSNCCIMIPAEIISEFPPEKCLTRQTWIATHNAFAFLL